MTPIPGHDGWYLTAVNRQQDDGVQTTEVAVTFFEHGDDGPGDTRTFRLPGVEPRAVILAAAADHIDRWGTT